MEQFPPNSMKSRAGGPKRKQVDQVTSAAAKRRKQPLGRQFRQTFFGGDARTALQYMLVSSIVPAIQELILDGVRTGLEYLVHGESRRNRRSPMSGPTGYMAYNRQYQQPYQPRPAAAPPLVEMSRPSRMRHAFDDIVIQSHEEAEEVLDQMYDLLSKYESVSVADLYELTGIESNHTDQKWGWEDLHGSGVGRIRGGGYLLELPEPKPLA